MFDRLIGAKFVLFALNFICGIVGKPSDLAKVFAARS